MYTRFVEDRTMEKLYYEIRPYALALFAIYAIKFSPSSSVVLSSVSGTALLICSAVIVFWRHTSRKHSGGSLQTVRVRK
jgi:hypothetical protein